ncbi:MAG TPA: N-acetyltransferase [Negativicutes bacterium]|nr:N-acetyltransferase [Negativicutes bacterium]
MRFRKPKFTDVIAMQELINVNADLGLMLPRSRNAIYETLRDFTVAEQDDKLIGVGALHIIWDEMAEIRALAIAPDAKKQGIGRQIVGLLVDEAKDLGVKQVFALTYQPGFFTKCGFTEVPKENLPHKVWKECINCPKFPNCDETAMIMNLQ